MKDNKQVIIVAVAATVLLVVVGWWLWKPANNDNFPDGTLWLCTNKADGQSFTMTMDELGRYNQEHYGEEMKCPKCHQLAVRAVKCPNCGKVSPQQYGSQNCPSCGKSLYLTGKE